MISFSHFLHLNTSFSDDIGLVNGKSAAVLYFSLLKNNFYSHKISISFLEEVLSQINTTTSLRYGNGIAGIGALIEFMKEKELLDEEASDLLEVMEPKMLNLLYEAKIKETNISEGLSGVGLYYLSKIKSGRGNTSVQLTKYKDYVLSVVDQLDILVKTDHQISERLTLMRGFPGVYLFLLQVNQLGWQEPSTIQLLNQIEERMLKKIHSCPLIWSKLEAWFALFQGNLSGNNTKNILKEFYLYLELLEDRHPDFYHAAFHALLLQILDEQFHIPRAEALSNRLLNFVNERLVQNHLGQLFTFDVHGACVPVGLEGGVCGTALPLLSLETREYDWLSFLGVDLKIIKASKNIINL